MGLEVSPVGDVDLTGSVRSFSTRSPRWFTAFSRPATRVLTSGLQASISSSDLGHGLLQLSDSLRILTQEGQNLPELFLRRHPRRLPGEVRVVVDRRCQDSALILVVTVLRCMNR